MRTRFFAEFLAQRRKGAKKSRINFAFHFAPLRLCARTVFLIFVLSGIAICQDPVETIRINSDLVDLKVSVLGAATNAPPPMLQPKDFAVFEDGVPQEIAFFQAADTPFDLVLLLDLSGSNSKNLKMIRNSAKRFVDAARDEDRIALVTFTDQPALYTHFSQIGRAHVELQSQSNLVCRLLLE